MFCGISKSMTVLKKTHVAGAIIHQYHYLKHPLVLKHLLVALL